MKLMDPAQVHYMVHTQLKVQAHQKA